MLTLYLPNAEFYYFIQVLCRNLNKTGRIMISVFKKYESKSNKEVKCCLSITVHISFQFAVTDISFIPKHVPSFYEINPTAYVSEYWD